MTSIICNGFKRNGTPCNFKVRRGKTFCKRHDPRIYKPKDSVILSRPSVGDQGEIDLQRALAMSFNYEHPHYHTRPSHVPTRPSSHEAHDTHDCSICQEGIDRQDSYTCLPCNHTYHNACIIQWENDTCPLCRKQYDYESINTAYHREPPFDSQHIVLSSNSEDEERKRCIDRIIDLNRQLKIELSFLIWFATGKYTHSKKKPHWGFFFTFFLFRLIIFDKLFNPYWSFVKPNTNNEQLHLRNYYQGVSSSK